jgi:hypothetical protein
MSGRKTNDNSQFAIVSADGTRATAGALPGANGDGLEPIADEQGRLWVRLASNIAPPGFPNRVQDSAAALINSEQVYAGPCVLSVISGFNNDGTLLRYAQVYDLAGAPGAGDVPVQSIPVAPMAEWSWSPDLWEFTDGIWFALSSTALSFTDPGGALGFWNAQLYTP